LPDLQLFAEEHQLQILTIADLIRYRLETEKLVQRRTDFPMHLDATGTAWQAYIYDTTVGAGPFLALVKGKPAEQPCTPCRVHSGGLLSDVFGSETLDGRHNLRRALEHIEHKGHGVLVYLPPKGDAQSELAAFGRRQGAARSSPSQPPPEDAGHFGPPLREFGLGAQILQDLGLHRIALLTNHPRKIAGIEAYGLEVVECVPLGLTTRQDE
jgi:3,4-dihydroxy 2-butanone 4-phosphate synthase/GTP cyclohydrolase II